MEFKIWKNNQTIIDVYGRIINMKHIIFCFKKLLLALIVIAFTVLVIGINEYYYSMCWGRDLLFSVDSPDSRYYIVFTRIEEILALYGEIDEIAIFDKDDNCIAIFEMFIPDTSVTIDDYEVNWTDSDVSIKALDTGVVLKLKFADVANRNISLSKAPIVLRILIDGLAVIFMIYACVLLFTYKNSLNKLKLLGVLAIITVLCAGWLYSLKSSRIEDVYILPSGDSYWSNAKVDNSNYALLINRLDRLNITLMPAREERMNLYDVYANRIGVTLSGNVSDTNYYIQFEDNKSYVTIDGDDYCYFEIINDKCSSL